MLGKEINSNHLKLTLKVLCTTTADNILISLILLIFFFFYISEKIVLRFDILYELSEMSSLIFS